MFWPASAFGKDGRWYQARADAAAAGPFLAAMHDADALPNGPSHARGPIADAFAKVAASSPEGYRTLARLREAALRSDAGDLKAALALWDQVANDGAANKLLRDLANLLWAQHQIDQGDPGAVTSRLKPLEDPTNPWRPLAQEADALLALRQGDKAAALRTLHVLVVDPTAPEGVRGPRQRAADAARRHGGTRMTTPTRRRLLQTGGVLSLLGLSGCEMLTDLFSTDKPPLPGKRETRHRHHARASAGHYRQAPGGRAACGAECRMGAIGRRADSRDAKRRGGKPQPFLGTEHRRRRRLPGQNHRHPRRRRGPGVHDGLGRLDYGVRRRDRIPPLEYRHPGREGPQHECRRRPWPSPQALSTPAPAAGKCSRWTPAAARSSGAHRSMRPPVRPPPWWKTGSSSRRSTNGCLPSPSRTASGSGATRRPPSQPACWASRRRPMRTDS